MGVWIETRTNLQVRVLPESHPVWVCGLKPNLDCIIMMLQVTPCMGVWIETLKVCANLCAWRVTPCMGVWIETPYLCTFAARKKSHPVWVCGLKPWLATDNFFKASHTLYGCVD